MKKIILSMVMCCGLLASTSLMAQDTTTEPVKTEKKCASKEGKACCKESKGDKKACCSKKSDAKGTDCAKKSCKDKSESAK